MKVKKIIFVWDIKTKRRKVKEKKKQKILFLRYKDKEKKVKVKKKQFFLRYKKNNGEAPWPCKEPKQLEYNKCGEKDDFY